MSHHMSVRTIGKKEQIFEASLHMSEKLIFVIINYWDFVVVHYHNTAVVLLEF